MSTCGKRHPITGSSLALATAAHEHAHRIKTLMSLPSALGVLGSLDSLFRATGDSQESGTRGGRRPPAAPAIC